MNYKLKKNEQLSILKYQFNTLKIVSDRINEQVEAINEQIKPQRIGVASWSGRAKDFKRILNLNVNK
jgi:hypothetical protein